MIIFIIFLFSFISQAATCPPEVREFDRLANPLSEGPAPLTDEEEAEFNNIQHRHAPKYEKPKPRKDDLIDFYADINTKTHSL